ncbi:MAG: hypothetical protein KBD53_11655 [Candidatus Omnitrophica bacterium]|nr:hypothetical protein [Candidatus Omnitrophota bacterium]
MKNTKNKHSQNIKRNKNTKEYEKNNNEVDDIFLTDENSSDKSDEWLKENYWLKNTDFEDLYNALQGRSALYESENTYN